MGPTGERVAWAGAERTENMYSMVVTLEVSKLSGWLNAVAPCRVQRGAWEAGDMQSAGGRRPVDGSGKHVGAIQLEDWAGAEPHLKHVPHARDAGGVEGQRLVERGRALLSPKGGMLRRRQAGQETGARGGGGLGSMGPTGEWVAWAGAERTENMYCMVVTLEVSKVSGWLNADVPCRVQREAC